jgi:hypothetical protein
LISTFLGPEVDLVSDLGDPRKLLLGAASEQRHPFQQLDLAVLMQHESAESNAPPAANYCSWLSAGR